MTVSSPGAPTQAPTQGKPLSGLRVVEVATYVAGPLGGMTLAQLGAEVIRVDPPGGSADYTRWPVAASGTSLYWVGLNKGKRSLCADFRRAEGRELITRLIAESGPGGGIVLTNADRPWLSYEALAKVRPDLIHLRIEGLHDGSPAVDYTVNASSGFPLVTGPEEHAGPVNHVLPAWDVACGLYAAVGILGAERHRRITGQGQRLSVALDDVALATAGNLGFLAEAEVNGVSRPRIGNHLYGSFARDFGTRDGRRVMVVALTARHWADLLTATGLAAPVAALADALGADFSAEQDRYTYRDALAGLLQRWFVSHDLPEVRQALSQASTLWSVYRSFRDLVEGDDLRANPLLGVIEQPGVGRYLAPASPIKTVPVNTVPVNTVPVNTVPVNTVPVNTVPVNTVPVNTAPPGGREPARAPLLGEHTAEILRTDLGLSEDKIRELHERGAVVSASPQR